jgi:hypothetical protein
MRLVSNLVAWVIRPAVGVLVGRVIYEFASHWFGGDPAKRLVAVLMMAPSLETVELARWAIGGAMGFLFLGGYEIWRSGWRPGRQRSRPARDEPDNANIVGIVHNVPKGGDVELIHALWHIATGSAWGKWFAAHHLASSGSEIPERSLMTTAETVFRQRAEDGEIEVRGRRPAQLDYEPIRREHWRLIFVDLEPDPRTLYRTVVKPRSGVELERVAALLEFDSLIVDRKRLNALWPAVDRKLDWARRRLVCAARWKARFGEGVRG